MDFKKYVAANAAWLELLNRAGECKALFEESGAAVPEELKTFLGAGTPAKPVVRRGPKKDIGTIRIPLHPYLAQKPAEALAEWIAVPAETASLSTLVLALMRTNNLSTLSSLQDAVRVWQPGTLPNSVYNVANRFAAEGVAAKSGSDFTLNIPENAPLLRGKLIWGTSSQMGDNDKAAFRRKTILGLLKAHPGLEIMQMVRTLSDIPWFPPRFHKDTLKGDLQAMQADRKVRRSPEGRGWIAIEKEVPSEEKTS